MADCTYRMKDAAGAWQTITGKPAMMAALADGRLDHLLSAGVVRAMTATAAAAPKETPAQRPAPAPTPNTIFTEDAATKARELLRRKLGQLNSGLDPEMLQAGITLAGYHIEKGARSFSAYAQAMLADLGDAVRPYLKSWYMGVKYDPRAAGFEGMDAAATVEAADENEISKEPENAPSTDGGVERNRQEPAPERAVGDAVQDERRGVGEGARDAGGQARRSGRRGQQNGAGVSADRAAAGGERSDQQLPAGNPADLLEDIAAGSRFRERGSDTGFDGVSADPIPASQVEAAAGAGAAIVPRIAQQRAAEKLTVVPGDLENIRATLPYLLPEQQDDVLKAEQRLSKPDGYGVLFTNGTGTGKAQPLDAKLMTPTGWRLMGDIKPGDLVMSVDGTPVSVIAVYPQGEKPIFRVTFSDGATTECCDEHLWETQTLYARRKSAANPMWDCARPKVRSLSEIRSSIKAQHFVPVAAALELQPTSLVIPPYIIGALLGDGCITQNTITFTSADSEIADRVSQDLPAGMSLRLREDGKRCPQYRISLDEQARRDNGQMEQHPWLRALREMGLHGCVSATKFVPDDYLRGSIRQRTELLQGLLDTDGWVDMGSRSPYFTSVSRKLADAVVFLARSLGGTATINTKRPTYRHLGEKRDGQLAYNVCLNLPEGIAPFALSRKAALYQPNTKYPPRRKIVRVDPVGTKAAQCIKVDHPRHLYVTDDCIVTHNTFTGLGVVKRAVRQGKTNILIAVPSDKIAADWTESGVPLGLEISKLKDTKDAGRGIVVTTYANLGANDALAGREWDMVVTDEAHKLMQAEDGTPTTYLENLRAITLHPDGAHQRYAMLNREDIDRMKALSGQIDFNNRIANADDTMDEVRASLAKENAGLEKERKALADKLAQAREEVKGYVAERQGAARPRLVALSATPFAYMKTVDWANGYLFDYNEGQPEDGASGTGGRPYNSGSNRERFFMQHFGYSMRYNKLNEPDPTKVDVSLLQRQFNAWLKKKGSLSGRQLEVNADYDRRFVLVDSAIGNQIDEALNWLSENARNAPKGDRSFYELRDRIDDKFDYLNRRYLLEAIKATEAIPIVKAHMAMGRKVIVFHDYLQGGGFNPFNVPPMTVSADGNAEDRARADQFNAALRQFNAKFSALVNAPLGEMTSPIDVFKRELPQVLLINGSENPKEKLKRYKVFQDDASGPQVMLVQSAQNAGWSGHDTTGKHQRVLINIGQPTAPTMAIQQEGRIYRVGQVSNAIMRYLNTGTSWEKWAFAQTIATRASAAENLGAGEQSRALKDSFIAAFEESDAYPPGHEGEGVGGKERDKAQNNALTAYDRAKTFYWATQKKNSKTKAQEGVDYFATPEPLGFKMVEWLGLRGGEDALEPGGGHGAIARWLPDSVQRTVIEPSPALRSRLAMVMDLGNDRIIDGTFEELANVNKFDGIVMNPPFGVGGKTAIEHLAKAAAHLRDGGRIVALIPTGPAADKRFEKWMNEEETREVKPLFEHPTLGPIYRGDTIESRAAWAPSGVVMRANRDGGLWVKIPGRAGETTVSGGSITGIAAQGPRSETYRPAEGLHQVADVRLPQVTFERAGTAVATRIVVIDKHRDPARAPNPRSPIDLSGISDIRELFNRLEDMSLPARTMTADQEAAAKAEQGEQRAQGGGGRRGENKEVLQWGSVHADPRIQSAIAELNEARDIARGSAKTHADGAIRDLEERGDLPGAIMLLERATRITGDSSFTDAANRALSILRKMTEMGQAPATTQPAVDQGTPQGPAIERKGHKIVEHVTKTGKTLRGIVAADITKDQAQEIDPYTFKKDGGWFIRERHIKDDAGPKFSREAQVPDAPTPAGITYDTLPAAFAKRFPKLEGAVKTMLHRGALGRKGGLVVLDTNDGAQIAREFASRTGWDYRETMEMFESVDGAGVHGIYDPKTGTIFAVGPNLDEASLPAVILHESIHGQQRASVDTKAQALLEGRAKEAPALRAFLDRVAVRMEEVGETGNRFEVAPYIVEMAVTEGRKAGFSAADGPILAWIEKNIGRKVADLVRDFVATLRAWALAHGVPLKSVAVDDLVAYAMAGVGRAARGEVVTLGKAVASKGGADAQFSRSAPLRAATKAATSALNKFSPSGQAALGTLSADQQAAVERVFGKPKTLAERAEAFAKDWKKNLVQGVFDQFAPIKEISSKGYMLARLAKGGDSTLEAMLMYGKVSVDGDGVYQVDFDGQNLKGFASTMAKLDGEHDRFLAWVSGQRAERLAGVGLENLMTAQDITALKTLADGSTASGKVRRALYAEALKELNAFNDSVLKIAADSGLIDEATRAMYRDTPYVPFYRLSEEEVVQGPSVSKGLVNQSAWKQLKGGTDKLNEDLMGNLLKNWSHLITASANNRAAKEVLDTAARMGAATDMTNDVIAQDINGQPIYRGNTKGLVRYRGEIKRKIPAGQPYIENGQALISDGTAEIAYVGDRYFRVDDPHLMDAIASIGFTTKVWKPMADFKRYLTFGVTVNPTFKIRNLIRDSIQAVGTADLSYNPVKNILMGAKGTEMMSNVRAQMLASGGMLRFGSSEGAYSGHVRRLIEKGVDPQYILDNDSKVKAFWRHKVLPAFEAYQELGDRSENVNRAALYEQLLAKGMSHAEASFWARDMMDFSMHGKWAAIRTLTAVVPFMNARLQGIYKLGRATKADYRRMGATLAAVSLASMALMLAYGDDDDWKKREDWDRDNSWWFKIGDTAFRIPKPFEVGAVGTIAERSLELMISDEMTGKRFGQRMRDLLMHNLSMNPTPQLVKPMIDLYANKDGFSGRDIETQGMEKMRPEDRYTARTSEVARFLGQLGLPNPAQLLMGRVEGLSPVQIDHLIRGYFSWVGTSATNALDRGIRPMMDRGEQPDMRLRDVFLAGNFVETLPSGSSRYVTQFYEQAKEIEQMYASYRQALKEGDAEKAQEIRDENPEGFAARRRIEAAKRAESLISGQMRTIERDRAMTGEEKRARLDQLEKRRDEIARRALLVPAAAGRD